MIDPSLPLRLVTLGDARSISTRGGSTYFLIEALRDAGLDADGVALDMGSAKWGRWSWNLGQVLSGRRWGGYQYTQRFAEQLFASTGLARTDRLTVMSYDFPLFPPDGWPDCWQVVPYIDATTRQVFDNYTASERVDPALRRETLEREQRRYQRATAVLCMSRWARRSLLEDYEVDPANVRVIPAGANLPRESGPAGGQQLPDAGALRLGFIGKDWRRKGLLTVLEVAGALRQLGLPVVVRVVGPDPGELPDDPLIEAVGPIDKRTQMQRFVDEIQSWHLGALLSKREAFGISNRECQALGIPAIGWDVGGIADTIAEGCGHVFPAGSSAEEIAAWICDLLSDRERYRSLRSETAARANEFRWQHAVALLLQ